MTEFPHAVGKGYVEVRDEGRWTWELHRIHSEALYL